MHLVNLSVRKERVCAKAATLPEWKGKQTTAKIVDEVIVSASRNSLRCTKTVACYMSDEITISNTIRI